MLPPQGLVDRVWTRPFVLDRLEPRDIQQRSAFRVSSFSFFLNFDFRDGARFTVNVRERGRVGGMAVGIGLAIPPSDGQATPPL